MTSSTAGVDGLLVASWPEAVAKDAADGAALPDEAEAAAFLLTISAKSLVRAAVVTAICDASAAKRAHSRLPASAALAA